MKWVLGRLGVPTAVLVALLVAAPWAGATTIASKPDVMWGFDDRVVSIVSYGGVVYVGGQFTHAVSPSGRKVARDHIAAIDVATGKLLRRWAPQVNDNVLALRAYRGVVYAGGAFTKVNGRARRHLVAIRAARLRHAGRVLRGWRPSSSGMVDSLILTRRRVYLGGSFLHVNGQSRSNLAAVSRLTGAVVAGFAPRVSGRVRALVRDGGRILIGGGFDTVDGSSQARMSAVRADTGGLSRWAYHPPFPCYTLVRTATTLFCGGAGGGGHMLAMSLATGAKRYVEVCDGDVVSVGLAGDLVVGGGHFNYWSTARFGKTGMHRQHLAAENARTRAMSQWNPSANSNFGVGVLYGTGRYLYMGGDFTRVGGAARFHFARFRVS